MHNFQTYPIDMLEFNPFTKIASCIIQSVESK